MRALLQPLLVSSLTLAVPAAFAAAADAAAAGADPGPTGEPIMRSRVEPMPQVERMAELAQRLSPETEAVWLETNSDRTLTLYYAAAQPEPYGALILLPDEHRHPDWPTDLHPLRIGLAQHGWDTLAVSLPRAPGPQMPERSLFAVDTGSGAASSAEPASEAAAKREAPMETYSERVLNICEAAIRHLESRQRDYLILLGSGSGADWAARCGRQFQDSRDLGLILLDAHPNETPGAPDLTQLLPELTLPILDLYRTPRTAGAPDHDPAGRRARIASRASLVRYHQSRLPSQSPDEDWLVREVRGRIERYLMPSEEPGPEAKPAPANDQSPGG